MTGSSPNRASKAQNEAIFDALTEQRADIERDFGEPLIWERRGEMKHCKIYVSRPGAIDDGDDELAQIHSWGLDCLLAIRRVVGARVTALPKVLVS